MNDDFQNAQLREWLRDTETQRDEAFRLLHEWDERETALAVAMCGAEPVVQPGSFVDRVRTLLAPARAMGLAPSEGEEE